MGPLARHAAATLLAIASLLGAVPILAANDHATVDVTINVRPYAVLQTPQGSGFTLTVPEPYCPPPAAYYGAVDHRLPSNCRNFPVFEPASAIVPERIPFVVEGNVEVTASVIPNAFLRISGGRYLGRAVRSNGASLGYDVVTIFPAPSLRYEWIGDWTGWNGWSFWNSWSGFGLLPVWSHTADLPGQNGRGTPPLLARLPALGGKAFGVIYIVARRDWTSNGADATPGNYRGNVIITITSD